MTRWVVRAVTSGETCAPNDKARRHKGDVFAGLGSLMGITPEKDIVHPSSTLFFISVMILPTDNEAGTEEADDVKIVVEEEEEAEVEEEALFAASTSS